VGSYCRLFRLPRTRIILTWSLLLVATTTDPSFIRFTWLDSHGLLLSFSRGFLSIPTPTDSCHFLMWLVVHPRTFDSFGSFSWTIVGSSNSHRLLIFLRVDSCQFRLPRTVRVVLMWLVVHSIVGLPRTTSLR
jgi:hypothetical protein